MDESKLEFIMSRWSCDDFIFIHGCGLQLAFDLDSEARDHLPLLDGISDEMESGRSRLGGSSGRLRNIGMTRGVSGRRLTCYVGFAIVTLLVFLYYVVIPHVLS